MNFKEYVKENTLNEAEIESDRFKFNTSNGTVTKYVGPAKDIVMPKTIEGNKILEIGALAFEKIRLNSIDITDTVTTIGYGAFRMNNLKNIVLPSKTKIIQEFAFSYNDLKSIVIPNSVTFIGEDAFTENPLTSITIGGNVKIDGPMDDFGFKKYYDSNGKSAGKYTLKNNEWSK